MDLSRPPVLLVLVILPAILLFAAPGASAQITSTGHALVVACEYERDNIYIFCNQNGNLSATLGEASGELNFEWSVYDTLDAAFGDPFRMETGTTSTVGDLESGGYRVRIHDGQGTDTLFTAWIFVNSPVATVRENLTNHTCSVLDLFGTFEIEAFRYFDPLTGEAYELPADYTTAWNADPFIPTPNRPEIRVWDPPPVTTEYTFTVNYYQCEASFSVTEDPVTTRAEFTIGQPEGEAPLEVVFDAGSSLNAREYNWFYYYHPDTTNMNLPDAHFENPEHTYYIPGEYRVMLMTVSEYFCEDFYEHPEPVKVWPSELEVPNVFTPDGDDFNDVFQVMAVSLRKFRGVILNRNGRSVFEWDDPSEGWDGTIGGTLASPGVYFYIITGEGWDDKEYEFTGPLYLYRGRP